MGKLYTSLKFGCTSPIEITYFDTFPKELFRFYCDTKDGTVEVDEKRTGYAINTKKKEKFHRDVKFRKYHQNDWVRFPFQS